MCFPRILPTKSAPMRALKLAALVKRRTAPAARLRPQGLLDHILEWRWHTSAHIACLVSSPGSVHECHSQWRCAGQTALAHRQRWSNAPPTLQSASRPRTCPAVLLAQDGMDLQQPQYCLCCCVPPRRRHWAPHLPRWLHCCRCLELPDSPAGF